MAVDFIGVPAFTYPPFGRKWQSRNWRNAPGRDKIGLTTNAASMNHSIKIHPGLVLKDELEERNISQTQLATHIGVLPKTINEICRGKRGISAEMAVQLSRALGASPGFWLNLQKNWELGQVNEKRYSRITKLAA
ncbi:MAG: HigA family addiction module antitoxin [Acidobacteriales bacterium]|nr:HigA family addiction module antitoxin [Terriglobales bacterium]